MHYVYILKSIGHDEIYIGVTINLKRRFAEHNSGRSFHTRKYMPWKLETYFAFKESITAQKFEEYLKTGSGKAFLKKRLI